MQNNDGIQLVLSQIITSIGLGETLAHLIEIVRTDQSLSQPQRLKICNYLAMAGLEAPNKN